MKLEINKTRHEETRNYCQEENSSKLSKCPICSEIITKQSHHDGQKSRHIQIEFQMKHEIAVEYVQLITKTFQYQ